MQVALNAATAFEEGGSSRYYTLARAGLHSRLGRTKEGNDFGEGGFDNYTLTNYIEERLRTLTMPVAPNATTAFEEGGSFKYYTLARAALTTTLRRAKESNDFGPWQCQ